MIVENCRKNYGIGFKVYKVAFIQHQLILFYSFRLLVYSLVRLDLHKLIACCTKFRWNIKQTKITMVFKMVNVNMLWFICEIFVRHCPCILGEMPVIHSFLYVYHQFQKRIKTLMRSYYLITMLKLWNNTLQSCQLII